MLFLTLASELIGIAILLLVIYFLGRPIIRGAIYFPTTPHGVSVMLKLADIKPGEKIVDLGSGDGRILIAAAKMGADAVGYEINPVLVRQSRRAIARAGIRAVVHWESFWNVDLSEFDVVIVYGIPYIMQAYREEAEAVLNG